MEREARVELVYFCLEGRRVTKNTSPAFGIPQETRTLTNGFGDRRAAITLGRNIHSLIKFLGN